MDAGFKQPAIPAIVSTILTSQHPTSVAALSSIPQNLIKPEDDAPGQEIVQFCDDTPNASTNEQKILQLLRQSILPFSDRLDPFAALPVALTRFQEHLVSFYLLHYPKVTYGFSPALRPHPVATNFSIALATPACFQVILARAALYRLSLCKYADDNQKKDLEVSMMRHKGEALREIRLLNAQPPSPTRKDDLIASIISIGTLDRRTGDSKTSGMHYMAVRRILKATGGPLAVKSLLLSRVMVFFECIYGTSPESYIWDSTDLRGLVHQVNRFLDNIWRLWQFMSANPSMRPCQPVPSLRDSTDSAMEDSIPRLSTTTRGQSFYLTPGTPLHTILTRSPITPNSPTTEPNPLQRLELMTQLTCLITLASLFLDLIKRMQYAALTMAILDLDQAVTKLCPRISVEESDPPQSSQHTSHADTSLPSTTSLNISSDKVSTTPPSADAPSAYNSNTSRTRAPRQPQQQITSETPASQSTGILPASTHRSIAPAPAPSSSTAKHPSHQHPTLLLRNSTTTSSLSSGSSSTLISTSTSASDPNIALQLSSSTTAESPSDHDTTTTTVPDPKPINASNIMWLLHITDHSTAHTERIWTCAAYAWVAKHLSYNTQKAMKEWLVRLLEGKGCFEEEEEEEKKVGLGGEGAGTEAKDGLGTGFGEGGTTGAGKGKEAVRERWTAVREDVQQSGASAYPGIRKKEGQGGGVQGKDSGKKTAARKTKEKPSSWMHGRSVTRTSFDSNPKRKGKEESINSPLAVVTECL